MMVFDEIQLGGTFLVSLSRREDERGFFARAYCEAEFIAHGLTPVGMQCNLAGNHERGTLRGLHYQVAPAEEAKLFRCLHGANYHVVVDMRSQSPTYLQHVGVELSAESHQALYVPEGCAHGYQALTDGSQAFYMVSATYAPDCERGLRYDDPALNIRWPLEVRHLSQKDARWPLISSPSEVLP